jgi:TetR/AcrR family transcriptional repressor of nem operon
MARPKQFERKQALGQAMEVFWAKGYGGASIQDLLAAMGINRGSLYDTFGSKRDLFRAAVGLYEERIVGRMVAQLEQPGSSGVEAIRLAFAQLVEECAGGRAARGCLLTNSAAELSALDQPEADQVARGLRRIEEAFFRALRRAEVAAEIEPGRDLRALACFFTSSMGGLRVLAKIRPGRPALEAIAATTLGVLD